MLKSKSKKLDRYYETMVDFEEEFEILDKDTKEEDINWLYGGKEYYITKEQMEALINGNKLYTTINGEYAFTIEMEEK